MQQLQTKYAHAHKGPVFLTRTAYQHLTKKIFFPLQMQYYVTYLIFIPSSVQQTQCKDPVAIAMTFFPCSPCTCRGLLTWSSDPWPSR